jgi:hypothetical protein
MVSVRSNGFKDRVELLGTPLEFWAASRSICGVHSLM